MPTPCLLWPLQRFASFLVVATCVLSQGVATRTQAAGTPKIAVAEQDPDFAVQGEYVGSDQAMQVIAVGDGEFDVVIYEGGLPGAGARGEPRRIESDIDAIGDLAESMGMKRIQRTSPTLGRAAPSGAIELFNGTAESVDQHWNGGKLSDDGLLLPGTKTKQSFADYRLHIEFRTPFAPDAQGQGRGNSGVYHQGRYETQVLDSFGLEGLDNESGGIYTVSTPTVNACLPPLSWQTYDVDFTAPRFDAKGAKTSNARMTVRLNGIIVQNDVEVPGPTPGGMYSDEATEGPIMLQDHGDPVRFRNVWLVPRDADREATRPIVPGFERFVASDSTPLAEAGEILMASLACTACHAADETLTPAQLGPDLSEVAGRVRADALVAMIANPHATKRGTTMPDPWPGADGPTRQQNSEKIASYLMLRGQGQIADRVVSQTLADRGNELYHSIGCVACHGSLDEDSPTTPLATTVPLGQTHRKYTVPSLIHFLQNCTTIRGGLRMPAMVGTPDEVAAVAAYLTRQTTVGVHDATFQRKIYRGQWEKLPHFDGLEPVQSDEVSGLKIDDVKPKNQFAAVFESNLSIEQDGDYTFLLSSDDGSAMEIDGHRLVNDGIHPTTTKQATYPLTAGIYPIRVEYFDGGGQIELQLEMIDPRLGRDNITAWITNDEQGAPTDLLPSEFVPDEAFVEEGEQLFQSAQCARCHTFDTTAPKTEDAAHSLASELNGLPAAGGCLAEQVQSPAVDFHLGATQVSAIRAALKKRRDGERPEMDDARRVHTTMATLNCYACHQRDGIGGPEPSRDEFFGSTTPEMGLEGRIPPSLTGVGDKLNDDYLGRVLQSGADTRTYMKTRMPAFDHEKLAEFEKAMVRSDRSDAVEPIEWSESAQDIQIEGRKLCGNGGLACIKCHSYNGNTGGGLGAIDMLLMPERLRPEWFQRYLKDPTFYRPGTRMPNSFIEGQSALTDIYEGDPNKQIEAMWQYLSLGTNAKEPQGLNQNAIVLSANERPRIYRNFFDGVSPRGIGVAYPGDLDLIWDANQMSLAQVWKNGFIDASKHWSGRGQGTQRPLGDAVVTFASAPELAVLDSPSAAWPTASGRELGYQMRGYRLDENGNPTFGYSIGKTNVEDHPLPAEDGFERRITIDAEADQPDQTLVWQFAEGQIDPVDEGYRIDGRVTMRVEGVDVQLLSVDGKQVLRAVIPPAATTTISQTIRW
ncbi:family 16 glycoside hydrolase [Allorhodopirellula solitaria]|uniref:Cytochrome c n=1 Tax=Allorhodopirellula solitaria TaxID=2527987 RepID=A0A5C5XP59_9BACT|nr:family 16 glycoside hydrolase [Allorhodopirellula solitaria]TWT64997.1 Cytochrome c [Allorhodopirellula solitaria]